MDLTPADIRNHTFGRAFRGCHPDEVQTFLRQLSTQFQRQLDVQDRLEEKVYELETKVAHYRQVEEALQEAIRTARESKEQTLEHAEREAALIVKEAEAKAAEIEQDAREEHARLKQETTQIGGRRHEIVARLRAFLMSEMELLAHFEGDDPVGYIKMLPPERQRQLQAAAEAAANEGSPMGETPAPLPDLPAPVPVESGGETTPAGEAPPSEAFPEQEERPAAAAQDTREPAEEASAGERSGPGWTVHPLFSADSKPEAASRRQATDEGRSS